MRPIVQHKLGNFELYFLNDGEFWLDGGSMFGIVPKNLWSKLAPPDEQNRVQLSLNPMLIHAGKEWILVETGIDRKPSEKFRQLYGLSNHNPMLQQLGQLGLKPSDISTVINTHLHFDHAGLNTQLLNGQLIPTFPNARHIVQRQELDDATHTHERNRASYLAHNIEPILNQFETVDGEVEIAKGIRVIPVPGHTLGMQAVELESEGQRLAYTADLIPTMLQTPLPYIMAFDLYPMTTLETRKKMYSRWLEGSYVLAFTHEPGYPLGRLVKAEKGYSAEALNTTHL